MADFKITSSQSSLFGVNIQSCFKCQNGDGMYLFEPSVSSLPIVGRTTLFPVNRVYCVGRNYADHTKEMGGDLKHPPFFFSKPSDSVIPLPKTIPYPPKTANLHHEVELVVALDQGGCNIHPDMSLEHIFGYAIGIDLTRRDLQSAAKERGHPWEMAKGFDFAAPCSALKAFPNGQLPDGEIALSVNGSIRQCGQLSQMIWSIAEIISELSDYLTLKPGDLIFTGTPSGVGPIESGDQLNAYIDNIGELKFSIE